MAHTRGGMIAWFAAAGLVLAGGVALSFHPISGVSWLAFGKAAVAQAATSGQQQAGTAAADGRAKEGPAAQLAKWEAALAEREANLVAREAQADARQLELAKLQGEVNGLRRVADTYAAMPPYKAGPLLERLEPVDVAGILRLLDQDEAAAILAYMEPAVGSKVTSELLKPAGANVQAKATEP